MVQEVLRSIIGADGRNRCITPHLPLSSLVDPGFASPLLWVGPLTNILYMVERWSRLDQHAKIKSFSFYSHRFEVIPGCIIPRASFGEIYTQLLSKSFKKL